MTISRRTALQILTALAASAALPATAAKRNRLEGGILSNTGAKRVPIEGATLKFVPLEPLKPGAKPPKPDLSAELTTGPDGAYLIDTLISAEKGRKFGVMPQWRYRITVEAAGHQPFTRDVTYAGGTLELNLVLTPA